MCEVAKLFGPEAGELEKYKEMEKAQKYLQLAKYNAELFSKDPHTKVGTIILTSDFSRVLTMGINGFPRKMNDDDSERWKRPNKHSWVTHAESNAIANAARTGTILDSSVAVITKFPCSTCTKLLIQAGITKIYTIYPDYACKTWGEDAKISEEMLNEVGLRIIKIDPSFEVKYAYQVCKQDHIKIFEKEYTVIDVSYEDGTGENHSVKVHLIMTTIPLDKKIEFFFKDKDMIYIKKTRI